MSIIEEEQESVAETPVRTPTRAQNRANMKGFKMVIKKLRKGQSAESIAKKHGISLEAIRQVETMIEAERRQKEEAALFNNPEIWINGEKI